MRTSSVANFVFIVTRSYNEVLYIFLTDNMTVELFSTFLRGYFHSLTMDCAGTRLTYDVVVEVFINFLWIWRRLPLVQLTIIHLLNTPQCDSGVIRWGLGDVTSTVRYHARRVTASNQASKK